MGLDIYHVVPCPKTTEVLDYFTVAELGDSPGFVEKHHALLAAVDEEEANTKGIYFQDKGYQRKGMNSAFYQDFQNDKLYFDLASVKKAYAYLKADHISTLEQLQQNFRQNFIDNFVEGESLFFASW
ncbi:hypothetical protein D0N36_14635 [Hymenobacter lapidiphilus]|uniref:hypothetical protein n=1 Tax=Hymenobacter sp. CCM 8763 TaxID=2303334 RepID=UPI000E349464|nr:hypothetical protein [Hymenobacter sp. CCM 8763]RFP64294.1 hypothetical protein D0N36_14635 [Hymenobacter sp. CCM 8763]